MADFGTALDMTTDLPARWNFASGKRNLGNAIVRRLITPRGALDYAPDYGLDVRQYVNMAQTALAIATAQNATAREIEKDPRVLSATVNMVFSQPSMLTINVQLVTAAGPFALVLGVTALTVQQLGSL